MSSDDAEPDEDALVGWTNERLETRLSVSALATRASEIEALVVEFKALSGQLFQARDDAKATFVRDTLVPMLEKRSKALRNKHTDARLVYDRKFEHD